MGVVVPLAAVRVVRNGRLREAPREAHGRSKKEAAGHENLSILGEKAAKPRALGLRVIDCLHQGRVCLRLNTESISGSLSS